jgi:hypothetical protein
LFIIGGFGLEILSGIVDQAKEFVSYLAFDTQKHGERPWERAHLDHTQIDLWLVDSETGLPLGRPWLTLLIDAYSRRVLAFWLTFDEPSYRSLMMVLRRCVERWRRLPAPWYARRQSLIRAASSISLNLGRALPTTSAAHP